MFDLVLDPLGEIQNVADSITTTVLALLNQVTTTNVPNTNACSFNETYTKVSRKSAGYGIFNLCRVSEVPFQIMCSIPI
jgi:hypothetical protein